MKEWKTKHIQKGRFTRKIEERPQSHGNSGIRKKLYQEIKQIDRSQQCPFLVRLFYAVNEQNHYKGKSAAQLPFDREIKLHLWMNSTLKQISELIRAMVPDIRSKQKFMFWRLSFNREKKQFDKEELGWVYTSKRYDKIQEKALCHTKFKIGDMLDVSITYK